MLVEELQNFKLKITTASNDTYEAWRESVHDDLVLAAAMAAWLGEKRLWSILKLPPLPRPRRNAASDARRIDQATAEA